MSETDRQTDNPKGIWWLLTAYGDNIEKLEDTTKYPTWVKRVYGGREECPETKRLHFQGALQLTTQMRRKAVLEWLKGCHLEVAKSQEAIKKYAMKSDTAVGDKIERVNTSKYYTPEELLIMIADSVLDICDNPEYVGEEGGKKLFVIAINNILMKDKRLTGQLMNPSIKNFFASTSRVWIKYAKEQKEVEELAGP